MSNNDHMDIEHSNEQARQSDSSYHMKSVKFQCQHCNRPFSVLNPENNRANCPRCNGTSTTILPEQQRTTTSQPQQQQSSTRAQPETNSQSQPRVNNTQPQQQQQQQQQNGPRLIGHTVRQTIFGPGQTFIIETFVPAEQPQPQPQPQAQPQNILSGLGNLLGFGSNGLLGNLFGGLFAPQPQAQPQPQPAQQPNFFGGNPFDLFGDLATEQPQPQPQPEQFMPQQMFFGLNPFNVMFMPARHMFFTGPDYDRLIEEFLRNDPNNHGPAPASQDNINRLHEFDYEQGKCKNTDCTVCQDDFQKGEKCVSLPCGHTYHKNCVVEWLTRHDSCPVCRKPISEQSQLGHAPQQENSTRMQQENPSTQSGF